MSKKKRKTRQEKINKKQVFTHMPKAMVLDKPFEEEASISKGNRHNVAPYVMKDFRKVVMVISFVFGLILLLALVIYQTSWLDGYLTGLNLKY